MRFIAQPATGHRLIPRHAGLFRDTGGTELDDAVLLCGTVLCRWHRQRIRPGAPAAATALRPAAR